MSERTYEQMTLTERAEAHILSARTHLGNAAANLGQLNSALLGQTPAQVDAVMRVAGTFFAGAAAEATLANVCALLAQNEGAGVRTGKLELPN